MQLVDQLQKENSDLRLKLQRETQDNANLRKQCQMADELIKQMEANMALLQDQVKSLLALNESAA